MRAVLTGTDLLKDIDGSFKAIETNTNIQTAVDATIYFNQDDFNTFISESAINEIVLISKTELNLVLNDVELNESNEVISNIGEDFSSFLKSYCESNGMTFTPIIVDSTSITVPFVEDSDNKLIIRIAFDTTAIIDDIYARDNWAFLKLMHDTDENSIPKTYINDEEFGFDSIGTTIADNGNHPNFLIKKRFTPADNRTFPKVLKISTIEELEAIKESLESEEYLQEYIYNPNDLIDNRVKFYRSVDLIYGSNLDVLNLWCVEHGNSFEMDEVCDYDDNNMVQYWERPKYIYKFINQGDKDPHLSGDENTMVLLEDNTKVNLSSLQPNSVIKTISIPNLPIDELTYNTQNWSSSYADFIENYHTDTATLKTKNVQENWIGFFYEIETTDGIKFSDVSQAEILCKRLESGSVDNYVVKFEKYPMLKVGDTILLYNTESEIVVDKQISNISISYGMIDVYTTDFEQIDVFLTMEEGENSIWGIMTHNYSYDCREIGYYPTCPDCSSGTFEGHGVTACCRCGEPGGYGSCDNGSLFYANCYDVDQTFVRGACMLYNYCNGNKSDKRLKKKIKHTKTLENGIKLYTFEFKESFIKKTIAIYNEDLSGVWEGVIAQDLIGTKFDIYVGVDFDGYYQVDYEGLGIKLNKIND
jgi:hypothetical protein